MCHGAQTFSAINKKTINLNISRSYKTCLINDHDTYAVRMLSVCPETLGFSVNKAVEWSHDMIDIICCLYWKDAIKSKSLTAMMIFTMISDN